MTASGRPPISDTTERLLWARSAGRCTLCNRLVTENEDLGEVVSIGEMAHNVGWGRKSPRGESELTAEERAAAENLLLLCRNCHRPVDAKGLMGRYSVEELQRFKTEHEQRIKLLTSVGGDRKATLIRVVGNIRGAQPELTLDTTLGALVRAGIFPELLPNAYFPAYEADLRAIPEPYGPDEFKHATRYIDELVSRVQEGVGRGRVARLAVFGFARIPLLVHLGAKLDDKVEAQIFQRQRVDGSDAWSWPKYGDEVGFDLTKTRDGESDQVSVVINLSGTISLDDLPADKRDASTIFTIGPSHPSIAGPELIRSPEALANFEDVMRCLLAAVERDYPAARTIDVFPAVPVSAAVTVGRVLMSDVSPTLRLFDRGEDGQFFEALEVKR